MAPLQLSSMPLSQISSASGLIALLSSLQSSGVLKPSPSLSLPWLLPPWLLPPWLLPHWLLAPSEPLLGVAEQRVGVVELLPKRAILLDGVERDPADHGVLRVELRLQITEAIAFNRSTGRVRFGVEPQDECLAGELGEGARVALVV